ncbi:hypothetical protein [Streptomyces sp. NPDC020965]|uniref:hypothetical protein n=1 Tax=Streptomyces sp. NPDC020965 TaxID=3365105 RepID=UPI0037A7BA80
MEAELLALATAGATALIQQMVLESWGAGRDRVVRFFSRGDTDPETVVADLETSRAELVDARLAQDEDIVADVLTEWRVRMRRTLRADPRAAAELRELLDELAPPEDHPAATVTVHNNVSGGTHYGPVIQTGTIGHLNAGGHSG